MIRTSLLTTFVVLSLTMGPARAGLLYPTSLDNNNQPFQNLGALNVTSGGASSRRRARRRR